MISNGRTHLPNQHGITASTPLATTTASRYIILGIQMSLGLLFQGLVKQTPTVFVTEDLNFAEPAWHHRQHTFSYYYSYGTSVHMDPESAESKACS
jgi:hypothetical protein